MLSLLLDGAQTMMACSGLCATAGGSTGVSMAMPVCALAAWVSRVLVRGPQSPTTQRPRRQTNSLAMRMAATACRQLIMEPLRAWMMRRWSQSRMATLHVPPNAPRTVIALRTFHLRQMPHLIALLMGLMAIVG